MTQLGTSDRDALRSPRAERVAQLLAIYDAPDASVAELLCDDHDPDAPAYRLIGPDLAAQDVTYGALRHDSERIAGAMSRLGVARVTGWRR